MLHLVMQSSFLQDDRTKKPPEILGPTFVHMEWQLQDYQSFFSGLLKLETCISKLKAFGTDASDGELGLVTALEICFPNAISLQCFIHKAGNIEEHLKGVPTNTKTEIMRHILGS